MITPGKGVNKIKILRVIARLNIGGPARHVVFLTEGLDNTRFAPSLVYGSLAKGEGDMSYLARERGLKTIYIPELIRDINPLRDMMALSKLVRIMRAEKPDIVHTHTAKAGALGRIAAVLTGVPIKVHTYHGHVFHGYFNKTLTYLFLLVERILAHFTDIIVTVSENQKKALLDTYKIGREGKYRVINLGLEIDGFADTAREHGKFRKDFRLGERRILIGAIGRLVPVKNLDMLIKAARELRKNLPSGLYENIRFVIVGDGPERRRLMMSADAQGLSPYFCFTGWVKDIHEAYTDIDIVALTSKNEGTPLSVIEAMAAGKPVIATDVGGLRDIVGGDAVLVPADDYMAFSEGLRGLITRLPDKGRGVERGERFRRKFSRERLVAAVGGLYDELLSRKGT